MGEWKSGETNEVDITKEVDIEKNLSAWWEYAIWGDRVVITICDQ